MLQLKSGKAFSVLTRKLQKQAWASHVKIKPIELPKSVARMGMNILII